MTTREQALAWYPDAYRDEHYAMGDVRKQWAMTMIDRLPKGSLFDVGCGRGEMIAYAKESGHMPVCGCETVKELTNRDVCYGLAHNLPCNDKSFDCVTMFDVMEHLTEDDCLAAIRELERVARRTIILSISNKPSVVNGVDLHITKKPYAEWDALLRRMLPHATIEHHVHPTGAVCDMWWIAL